MAELLDFHAHDPDEAARYEEWVDRLHERRVLLQRTVAEIDGRLTTEAAPSYWEAAQVFADGRPTAEVPDEGAPTQAEVMHALAVLDLPVGASADEVASRFRSVVKLHHPDIHVDADDATRAEQTVRFRTANQAINVLRRAAQDR